ncbi:hypothetical protein CARUB_v10010201mg [Capsella rubella]|uniref:Ribosome assembly factor mrt4 n=1 Tax=Capsella rubella TaxID=81985 RepID=R0GMA4_9BRAS|nr:hypothetical protein CARUB_v10010201mg [Capsella rubella]
MPKSKRDRPVTLSKTKKKGKEHKECIINGIREAVEKYSSVYVFSFENMRNIKFNEFRQQFKHNGRFFLGSNKVMQVALGRDASTEIRSGIYNVSKLINGNAGLLVTDMPKDEVESLFNAYEDADFSRTGSMAAETVALEEGPLEQFTHEMEPLLRKLNMPVRLNKGTVELVADFVVCEEGKPLSPQSAHILVIRLLYSKTFSLIFVCFLERFAYTWFCSVCWERRWLLSS